MGWKEEARRSIVGENVELKSFPGHHVRPRKYSIETKDRIRELEKQQQGEFNRRALAKIAKKMGATEGLEKQNTMAPADIMALLTEEEFEALYEVTEKKTGSNAQIMSVKIAGGIAEHDFEGTSVDQLAKEVLEYADIAREMVEIADRFNRPLAKRQSGTSGPSPDGSITDVGSPLTAKTSPTDETPSTS